MATTSTISADEIALYDRQIRLWGMQAQERMRSANILLIGLKGLGNEVAKNLVLAGIGSVTVLDNAPVFDDDLGAQFLISESDIGKPRAQAASTAIQKLNPRVTIKVENRPFETLEPSYFAAFDVTIATDLPIGALSAINAAAHLVNCPFYAAGTHGFYGFVFADLVTHTFVVTRAESNIPTKLGRETRTRTVVSSSTKTENGKTVELVTKQESYQPLILANTSPLPDSYLKSLRRLRSVTPLLPCLRALWDFEKIAGRLPLHNEADLMAFTTLATEKSRELMLPPETLKSDFLRSFLQSLGSEMSPVCAVLGAQLAQDVINVLGKREQPIQNMLLFDGEASVAPVYALCPIVPAVNGAEGVGVGGLGMGGGSMNGVVVL